MSLAAGTHLGPYQILAPLGAGGMGEVYRAKDTKLDREVAIKILPEAVAQDPERLARFAREAKVLASLNHPHIAQIYAIENGALVMELIDGATLSGPLPMDTALDYARQISDALEAAHEKGIIHRDLKPANIMVTRTGVVKVLDFGLAAVVQDSSPAVDPAHSPTLTMGATQSGMIMGTAAYMSPEQARGKPVDKRADIWAFGVVLYEMIAGRRLFQGESVSDTLAAVLREEPPWDGIPTQVQRLLKSCLTKDPRRRLRDIGDAWRLLEDAPGATAPSRSGDKATDKSRLGIVASAVAAAAIVCAAVLAFVHFRETPPDPDVVRFQIQPPDKTDFGGVLLPSFPVVSPDGRQLAFFARGADGRNQIWIRSLHALEARPLSGTEGNTGAPSGTLAWSPDSRSLAFITAPRGRVDLKRIEVSGGPSQTLVAHALRGAPAYAWSREDVILFNAGTGLARVSASGGAASTVTTLDTARGETRHTFPSFLPDGRHFVYVRSATRPENSGVYVGSLDAKPDQQSLRRLLAAESGAVYAASPDTKQGHLLFLRGGTLLAQPVQN